MILIFSKKYDIVYHSYTDVKTHLKSKWPEKTFLKMILIFSKEYDIVYHSYTNVKL